MSRESPGEVKARFDRGMDQIRSHIIQREHQIAQQENKISGAQAMIRLRKLQNPGEEESRFISALEKILGE